MSKLSCVIKLGETPLHLYQILSGFKMLKQNSIIDLRVDKLKNQDKNLLPYNMIEVIINNKYRIIYDVNDGYDNLVIHGNENYVDFMNRILTKVDFYFKRSYSTKYNLTLVDKHKIYPLGLNYMVTVPGNVAHNPNPNDPNKEKFKKLIRKIPFSHYYNGLYYPNSFEDFPIQDIDPKILFMARLWDTNGDGNLQLSNQKKDERAFINEFRVNCIRMCKKEFGSGFFGGISPTKFSVENYPDVVIHDTKITKRNNYINKVKESSICIASMGLHESIGWKFAEYVAASKAIVTETLQYELPGDIEEGKNYLAFKSPEECVEKIYMLKNDNEFRYQMMLNNFNYYHKFVRPDQLVLNSLITVIKEGGKSNEANFNNLYSYV